MDDNLNFWGKEDFDNLPEDEGKDRGTGRRRHLFGIGRGQSRSDGGADASSGEEGRNEGGRSHRKLMMAAMLAVLGMAGGTLGIVSVQTLQTNRRLEAEKSKDERMQQQLEEIQGYLSGLDQSVSDGQVTDAADYEELSATVQTLQGNLVNYRDNNEIQNDAIGENLDDVILELASIQENLEANRKEQEDLNGDLSSDVTSNVTSSVTSSVNQSVDKGSRAISASIDEQVSGVREDIRKLIQEASAGNQEQYQELVSILNGTDADLGSLSESVKTLAEGNEEVKKTVSSGLGDVNGSIAGVRDRVSGIQNGVSALQTGIGTLESSLGKIEAQGNVDSTDLQAVKASVQQIQNDSAQLQRQTDSMTAYINDNAEAFSGTADNISAVRRNVETLSSTAEQVEKAVDSLPSDLKKELSSDSDALDDLLQKSEEIRSLKAGTQEISVLVQKMKSQVDNLNTTVETASWDLPEARGRQIDRIETAVTDSLSKELETVKESTADAETSLKAIRKYVDTQKSSGRSEAEESRYQKLEKGLSDLSAKVDILLTRTAGQTEETGTASGSRSDGSEDHGSVPVEGGDEKTSEDHAADHFSGSDSSGENPEGSGDAIGEAENQGNDDGI